MSATIHAILPGAAVCTAVPGDCRRFRLDSGRLRKGMFVAELDRPWLDTPFLIQGFLADSEIELKTLQRYCRYVYVDLDRSSPELAGLIRAAGNFDADGLDGAVRTRMPARSEASQAPHPAKGPANTDARPTSADAASPNGHDAAKPPLAPDTRPLDLSPDTRPGDRATPATRAYAVRADVRISRETRERFRSFVRGGRSASSAAEAADATESLAQRAFARLRGLFGPGRDGAQRGQEAGDDGNARLLSEIAAALPRGTVPELYTNRRDAASELPRARRAFALGDEALALTAADVRTGRPPNVHPVEEAVDQMVGSLIDNPDALLWVAQMREESQQACQQGVRVALFLILLGRQLGLPRQLLSQLGMTGMLADVGKARLPRALLDKPGMLNPAEYSIIKEHVRLGLEALSTGTPIPPEVERGIAQHHERMDGSGYPKGLQHGEIGLFGRMTAIADSFAALSAPRAYANPLAAQDALMNLYQWSDTSFDGPLVEQFVQAVGVFPVGSMVELAGGEVAVVAAHNRVRRLEPRVLLLTTSEKRPLPLPLEIDLLDESRRSADKPLRVIRGLPPGAYGLKLRDYYADGSVSRLP